jgi:hypothetical protein
MTAPLRAPGPPIVFDFYEPEARWSVSWDALLISCR